MAHAPDTIRVPASVEAVLAARIERLAPDGRELLRWAAVIGTHVPAALLRVVVPAPEEAIRRGLAHLMVAELLYETRVVPDPAYTFKHALTHQVAYDSLFAGQRRLSHARVVEAIERTYRERLAEHVEELAHHAVRGGLPDKAVDYLRRAGQKAAARSALPEARSWLEQALDVLAALPESRSTLEQGFEIRLELRPVLTQLGEVGRTLDRLREAESFAERLDDDSRRGRVYALLTNIRAMVGELDDALATGTRALALAGRLEDLPLRILATTYFEVTLYYRGEYERVVELATENLGMLPADRIYEYLGMPAPPSVYDRGNLVMTLSKLGRFAEAAKYEAEAIRLADLTQHAYTVGYAYRTAAKLHLLKGDWARALARLEHAVAALRTGNVPLPLPIVVASLAWALAQLGEVSEARTRLQEGEQLLDRQTAWGLIGHSGWAYHALGRVCLLLGSLDEARRLGERAVESCPRHPGFAAHAWHLLGDVATHPDRLDVERGETHYRRALALAETRGMRPLVAHCHLGLGRLYGRSGDEAAARKHLSTAATTYREMGMGFWLEKTEVLRNLVR